MIEEFNLNREIRYYKDKIYEQVIKERARNKEIINEFDSTISKKEKENAYNKLASNRNKIDINNALIDELVKH